MKVVVNIEIPMEILCKLIDEINTLSSFTDNACSHSSKDIEICGAKITVTPTYTEPHEQIGINLRRGHRKHLNCTLKKKTAEDIK